MLKHPYPLILSVLSMITIFVVSNILVTFAINDWLTWGAFTFPLVFLVSDLTNRSFGPTVTRQLAWFSLPFALLISGYFAGSQIAIASATAFIMGQMLDIMLFNRLRQKSWWLAPWCGSMVGSVLDTIFFFGIAFYDPSNPAWWQSALQFGVGDLAIKWLMAIVLLAPYRLLLPYIGVWKLEVN